LAVNRLQKQTLSALIGAQPDREGLLLSYPVVSNMAVGFSQLHLEPTNRVYQYHLGMALARIDDAAARRLPQRALQLDPRFSGAPQARKTLASLVY